MGVALAVLVLATILVVGLIVIEPRMIYYPTRVLETLPSQFGWPYEEVWLEAGDGVRIHGWFIPAAHAERPVTILFLHGNAGNISHRFEKLAVLRDLGADVLIVDYRGYGRSQGRPGEAGFYRDARAAHDHLTRERGRDPRTIALYGESLGSAVAVELASTAEIGGLILESAFTSAPEVGQAMFPFLPVRWVMRHRYDSLAKITRVEVPILLLHSRDDEYFPIRHAERLAEAAGAKAKRVVLRGGHNDAFLVSADTYRSGLEDFLAKVSDAHECSR